MSRMEYGWINTFSGNDGRTIMATDGSRAYWDRFGGTTTIVWWNEDT